MPLLRSSRPTVLYAALALLFAAVLLGGASRLEVGGWMGVAAVAVAGAVVLVWTAYPGMLRAPSAPLALIALALAIPLVQLVPLPNALWTRLPGHWFDVAAFQAAGIQGSLPISVLPGRTLVSLFSFVAPFIAFLIVCQLDQRGRGHLAAAMILLACASAVLGILQVSGGPQSELRLYEVTANDAAVGFFANPNHNATFLMSAVALCFPAVQNRLPRRGTISPGLILIPLAITALLGTAMVMTNSRAGVAFLGIALVGSILLVPELLPGSSRRRERLWIMGGALLLCVAAAAAALLSPFGEAAIREHGGSRVENIPRFLRIIGDFLPFGSGMGTFDPVNRTYEALETMRSKYLNQAHNEIAQMGIEAGIAGLVLIAAFTVWWAGQAVNAWRYNGAEEPILLRRAASIGGLLFLLHCLVDYPLRTSSGAVVFAMLCALMLPPPERANAP
jgi:O-antigen ligase